MNENANADRDGDARESDGQRTGTDDLLTSAEVAARFGVHRTTVVLWAKRGRIPALRTPGGALRFRADETHRLLGRTGDDDSE